QFMQLFDSSAIVAFYHEYGTEIEKLCAEDQETLEIEGSMEECTKHALEKVLMLIEGELKKS
ncbi:unnamed protein product, partial [marine sediment metagenome]